MGYHTPQPHNLSQSSCKIQRSCPGPPDSLAHASKTQDRRKLRDIFCVTCPPNRKTVKQDKQWPMLWELPLLM